MPPRISKFCARATRGLRGVLCTLLLSACYDTAVVGIDRCASADAAACEPPTEHEDSVDLSGDAITLHTRDAQRLDPTWERTIPVADAQYNGARLTGNGKAGLWYLKPPADRGVLEVYRLDEGGEDDTAVRVLSSGRVMPPSISDFPASYNNAAALGSVTLSGLTLNDRLGEAPIITAAWRFACSGDVAPCGGDEIIALQTNLQRAPLRIFAPLPVVSAVVRTRSGGAWLFGIDYLAKYAASGELIFRQETPVDTIPAALGQPIRAGLVDLQQMAITTSDEPVLLVEQEGLPRFWHLDEQGEKRTRAYWLDSVETYPVLDRRGRVVLLTMKFGDLTFRRLELDSAEVVSTHTALRDDYTNLVLRDVSEDAAGNLYVLTASGPRDATVPTLCKLPLDGDLSCYLLPALHGRMIAGGSANVLYAASRASDDADVAETLQRYDLP